MALAAHNWTSTAANLANGTLPLTATPGGTAGYRVILFNGSATDPVANVDTDATIAAVKTTMTGADELASSLGGSNYVFSSTASGSGQALGTLTWAKTSHTWAFGCANPAWTTAGSAFNPAYAVFFYIPNSSAADTASIPLCWWNFNSGAAVPGGGGTYTLSISGSGLYTMTGTG